MTAFFIGRRLIALEAPSKEQEGDRGKLHFPLEPVPYNCLAITGWSVPLIWAQEQFSSMHAQ